MQIDDHRTRLLRSAVYEMDKLVRLLPDWQLGAIDIHAVFASGRAAKPAARLFADFLKVELGQ